jgi:hypothetical protein
MLLRTIRTLCGKQLVEIVMKSILGSVFVALVLCACSPDPNVVELEKAAGAIEQLMAPLQARQCSFFVVLPNGTPREFVSWFFSPLGAADWPIVEGTTEITGEEQGSLRMVGTPFRPKDVEYRHTNPDPAVQKQIVLKWDDAEGKVILEGYLDPAQPPSFTRSFKIPKNIEPDPIAKIAVQSNLEMGMSFQSF